MAASASDHFSTTRSWRRLPRAASTTIPFAFVLETRQKVQPILQPALLPDRGSDEIRRVLLLQLSSRKIIGLLLPLHIELCDCSLEGGDFSRYCPKLLRSSFDLGTGSTCRSLMGSKLFH